MNERSERIKEVFSDEAFVKTLLEAENEEAVQKMLADKGVEMSLTQIELLGELLEQGTVGNLNMEAVERLSNSGGELSDDELEQVAGGGIGDIVDAVKDIFVNTTWVDKTGNAVKLTWDNLGEVTAKYSASNVSYVAAAVVGVAAIGYGIYDAVRRRW